jgi:hypothetical protein
MRDWHVKHMEQTIIKYIEGLPEGASRYQQKLHKKYGGIGKMCNMIEYDMKHGVTNEELLLFLRKIRTEPSYSELRKNDACLERLHEIELRFR